MFLNKLLFNNKNIKVMTKISKEEVKKVAHLARLEPVSYTHLTLPTICSV